MSAAGANQHAPLAPAAVSVWPVLQVKGERHRARLQWPRARGEDQVWRAARRQHFSRLLERPRAQGGYTQSLPTDRSSTEGEGIPHYKPMSADHTSTQIGYKGHQRGDWTSEELQEVGEWHRRWVRMTLASLKSASDRLTGATHADAGTLGTSRTAVDVRQGKDRRDPPTMSLAWVHRLRSLQSRSGARPRRARTSFPRRSSSTPGREISRRHVVGARGSAPPRCESECSTLCAAGD